MEFDKTTKSEEVEHAESEAPKKVRKKKTSKEKKTGVATTTKRIKAPVPAEILAEEDKKDGKEKPKAKKTRKKSKKAVVSEASPTELKKKDKGETKTGTSISAKEENTPKTVSQTETMSPETLEKSNDDVDDRSHQERVTEDEGYDVLPDESFERTILPQDVEEEEGELFISDRLRRLIGKDKKEPNDPLEAATTDEEDDDKEDPQQGTVATVSQSTGRSSQVHSKQSIATPTPPSTGTTKVTGSGGSGGMPPLGQANFSAPLSPNVAPTASQAPAVANTAPYRNRTAERRNLLAGIIVGGVIEHIRHKRREKRMEATQKKEVEKLKKTQQFQEVEQYKEKQKTERTKTMLEQQLDRLKQSITPAKSEAQPTESSNTEQPVAIAQAQIEAQRSPTLEATPAASNSFYEDFKRKYRSNETIANTSEPESKSSVKTAEKPAPVPKQQPENIDEPIPVSPDRRVETSAWHRIEVDKKTGKAIENPELAYGEEFQNEQHQEQLRKQIDEASIKSEEVRQNYMPIIDKTSSTTVQTHDPIPNASSSHKQKSQKMSTSSSINDTLQDLRDRAGDSTIVDYALVGILFLIIIAIIALLV